MTDADALGPWLRRFLAEHLVSEHNLARNTQLSYRDTLALLLPFVADRARKPVERLAVLDLTAECVLRSRDEGEGDRPLRRKRTDAGQALEGGQRLDGVHPGAVRACRCVTWNRARPLCSWPAAPTSHSGQVHIFEEGGRLQEEVGEGAGSGVGEGVALVASVAGIGQGGGDLAKGGQEGL